MSGDEACWPADVRSMIRDRLRDKACIDPVRFHNRNFYGDAILAQRDDYAAAPLPRRNLLKTRMTVRQLKRLLQSHENSELSHSCSIQASSKDDSNNEGSSRADEQQPLANGAEVGPDGDAILRRAMSAIDAAAAHDDSGSVGVYDIGEAASACKRQRLEQPHDDETFEVDRLQFGRFHVDRGRVDGSGGDTAERTPFIRLNVQMAQRRVTLEFEHAYADLWEADEQRRGVVVISYGFDDVVCVHLDRRLLFVRLRRPPRCSVFGEGGECNLAEVDNDELGANLVHRVDFSTEVADALARPGGHFFRTRAVDFPTLFRGGVTAQTADDDAPVQVD